MKLHAVMLAIIVPAIAACGGKARSADAYRADTRILLDMRQSQIEGCYNQALATDATLAGNVKVTFVVEKKTGLVTKTMVDPKATTAPEPLQKCVVDALGGLKLDPPDRNEGQASFEYAFEPPAAT